MDEFARLPTGERRLYFEQAAARLGLVAQVIEKDFWVCWSLKQLFSLAEFQDHLTFKGGTSLSKVYRVIERFSEDVDVAIERGFLGFGGDMEPERGTSGKEQQRRVVRLKEACQATISERLAPQLQRAISTGIAGSASWSLTADPADRDQQTLLFQFPPALATELSPYFSMSVKIEMGARSDHFPVEAAEVKPYLCDAFPDALSDKVARVRVLAAERTFNQAHHRFSGRDFCHSENAAGKGGKFPRALRGLFQKMKQIPGKSITRTDEYLKQNAGAVL